MPIYEFKCRKCGKTFDVLFRSRDEKVIVDCPECKSTRTQRLMSAFAPLWDSDRSSRCFGATAFACGLACQP